MGGERAIVRRAGILTPDDDGSTGSVILRVLGGRGGRREVDRRWEVAWRWEVDRREVDRRWEEVAGGRWEEFGGKREEEGGRRREGGGSEKWEVGGGRRWEGDRRRWEEREES